LDWKSATWILERRFPAEFGQQQQPTTPEAVLDVLKALASLREGGAAAELKVHRPPVLPSTVDASHARVVLEEDAPAPTHVREG
jgi:hypothetical protein